jgi:hypothetical protein
MPCLFRHKWNYDLRFYHVHRKCRVCEQVQRHVWNRESVYTAWETIREREYVESEQLQFVRAPSTPLARWAHAMGLLRNRSRDRAKARGYVA